MTLDATLARELTWLRRLPPDTLARAYGVLLEGGRTAKGPARHVWRLLAETAAARLAREDAA